MEVKDEAYGLIQNKLTAINDAIIFRVGKVEDTHQEIRDLVDEIRQIMDENFIVGGNDEPPAA